MLDLPLETSTGRRSNERILKDEVKVTDGEVSNKRILPRAFAKYVPARGRQPVRRYLYRDAVPHPADFLDTDTACQRQRRRHRGRHRAGNPEYRARIFGLAVGPDAEEKIDSCYSAWVLPLDRRPSQDPGHARQRIVSTN